MFISGIETHEGINVFERVKLRHFSTTLPQPIRSEEDFHPFERLYNSQTDSKHHISQIIKILTESTDLRIPRFIE